MAKTIVETKTDLELFAERLSRGGKLKPRSQHSPTADELAALKRSLDKRLRSALVHRSLKERISVFDALATR